MTEQFKKDVDQGLSQSSKYISSKYFYDEIGDALFAKIMHLPEYYLTRSELEIFKNQSNKIIDHLEINKDQYFELIELGAGDGLKTKELLKCLQERGFHFDYFPVDISQNALDILEKSIKKDLPKVNVVKKQGDYFEMLASFKERTKPKVILFLGSNIGNMSDEIATEFIYNLGSNLHKNDKLLLGVDLIKEKSVVLPAYNDNSGVTKDFNLNLLHRMNTELGANFVIHQFEHLPEYSEKEGIAKSFLASKANQNVYFKSLDKTYSFTKGEKIATEISRKYNDNILQKILKPTDFFILDKLTDSKAYFANYILCKA